MKAPIKVVALQALWVPCVWTILFCLELAFFVETETHGWLATAFEKLVILMSFLFYSSRGIVGYIEKPVTQIFLSFTMQFFFWWVASFVIIFLKKRLKGGQNV